MYKYTQIKVHTYKSIQMYMYTHILRYKSKGTHINEHTNVKVHTHMQTYTCTGTHIYKHTHDMHEFDKHTNVASWWPSWIWVSQDGSN